MKLIIKFLLFTCIIGILLMLGLFFLQKTFFMNDHDENIVSEPLEDLSVEQFIGAIGETARDLAGENDLYASVLLAQAILESDRGKSQLASEPYFNLFGMKGNYQNESIEFKTLEDDGKGNLTTIVAAFRKYPSYEASIQDYVDLLRKGVSWDAKFYEPAFKSNTSSYQDATAYLTGTYATDSSYEEKLNELIEQYDLAQYDLPVEKKQTIKVRTDDSLVAIAEKYRVSVTLLQQWNQLQSSQLEDGQELLIYGN